jgi:hypothetical protein
MTTRYPPQRSAIVALFCVSAMLMDMMTGIGKVAMTNSEKVLSAALATIEAP